MRHIVSLFSLLVLLLLLPGEVKAATITVSPGQSIQTAINSASSGDIIQIRAGTYNERLSISKSLTVTGYPGEKPVIDGQNSRSEGIVIGGTNITVSNLKVTNHTGHDIEVDRSSNVVLDGLRGLHHRTRCPYSGVKQYHSEKLYYHHPNLHCQANRWHLLST